MQLPDLLTDLDQVHIGVTYKAVLGENGEPALEEVITRGRPRSLAGEQLAAARALRKCGLTISEIGDALNASTGAVCTALGVRCAS